MAFKDAASVEAESKLEGKGGDETRGRRDAGKEENPDEKKFKEQIAGLSKALAEKREAIEKYNKKRKSVAKITGFMSNVCDKAAAEYLSEPEDREMAKRHAEQLDLALGIVEQLKAKKK